MGKPASIVRPQQAKPVVTSPANASTNYALKPAARPASAYGSAPPGLAAGSPGYSALLLNQAQQADQKPPAPKPTLRDLAADLVGVERDGEAQKQAAGQSADGKPEDGDGKANKQGDGTKQEVGKGAKGGKARRAKPAAAGDKSGERSAPSEALIAPPIDSSAVSLPQSPLQAAIPSETFKPSTPPESRAASPASKSANADRAAAHAVFRDAIAQSAEFHASFLNLAGQTLDSIRTAQAASANAAQRDLDRGLSLLRSGLDKAKAELDRRADQADSLITLRQAKTKAAISAAANSALGTLGAHKKAADAAGKVQEGLRDKAIADGNAKKAEVVQAGRNAALAVEKLEKEKEKAYPTSGTSKPAAINEAVQLRLPERGPERTKVYNDEAVAQEAALSKEIDNLKTSLDGNFAALAKAMNETATSSAGSIVRSRDAARKQLASGVADLRRTVAQSRARGHAALVTQHNSLRRNLVASHRERAGREALQAQQRASRATGSAVAAARGQQGAATALGESLKRETARAPSDLAKAIKASALGLLRQTTKSSPEQRSRIEASVRQGNSDAQQQAQGLVARFDRSAGDAARQVQAAATGSADALAKQVDTGTQTFEQFPPQIRAALKSVLGPTIKAYQAMTQGTSKQKGMSELVKTAGEAVKAIFEGTGGGTSAEGGGGAAAPAGGKKGPSQKPNEFKKSATGVGQQPKTDPAIADLEGIANKDIPDRIEKKVGSLFDLLQQTSTSVEGVMVQLRGLTRQQGRYLTDVYNPKHGDLKAQLSSELRKTFSDGYTDDRNVAAALAYLSGNAAEGAKEELQAAVYLWNDTGRSEKVLRALTPEQLDELRKNNPGTLADVSGDLDGAEKKTFDALKEIKPLGNLQGQDRVNQQLKNFELLGVANAYGLKRDIDVAMKTQGEAGGDKAADAVTKAWQSAGSDTLSGGDGPYEDPRKAEIRRQATWMATDTAFAAEVTKLPDGSDNVAAKDGPQLGAIARYAAGARTYTVFVADESESGGHFEEVKQGLDPRQARLIDDIAKTGPNSEDTAASTIEFETNRKEGAPREDRLRKALLGEDLMGAREGELEADRKMRLEGKDKDGNLVRKGDEALTRERKEAVFKKVAERQAEEKGQRDKTCVAPQSTDKVQKQILDKLDARFSGDPTGAAYTKSMIASPTLEPDPQAAFDFALAHKARNKETLVATTERMTRSDVLKSVGQWDQDKGRGKGQDGALYRKIGLYGNDGALEGDARNEVEIAFRGKPKDEKEKALIAIMVVEQQHRDGTDVGRGMARAEYNAMIEEQGKVLHHLGVRRDQIDEKGDIKLGADNKTEVVKVKLDKDGKLILTADQRDDFESAMRFSHMNAESYKQAVDRISQGIVMALVIAAAVITTFFTFGGAAAFWGPVLITAAAGFAGMMVTAAIRGDRYTSAEMQRDFVLTLVTAVTAGIGSVLGAGAKGAGAAAKGVAGLEKGVETAAKAASAGEKIVAGAATATAKQSLTFGGKALQFGKEVLIGGGSNAVNSFAAGAMDPENRRQGKALSKAVDGGIRGFVSGSIGAALNKPMSALGKPLGKAATNMAGDVGSGFVSRVVDARVGQAQGDPEQSWAESIEAAKEGIAQDAIQSYGSYRGQKSAARRDARKMAGGSEPHPLTPDNDNQQHADTGTSGKKGSVTDPGAGPSLRLGHDDAPDQTLRRASGDDSETGTLPRPGQGDDPGGEFRSNLHAADGPTWKELMKLPAISFEQHAQAGNRAVQQHRVETTADLTAQMLRDHPSLPEGSVIKATNPKSFEAALSNYHALLASDPHRELLLAFHPETGDYAVVQGNTGRVGTPSPSGWIGQRHVHPRSLLGTITAHILHNLPSGIPGDFGQLFNEVRFLRDLRNDGNVVVQKSQIDVVQPDGSVQVTTFSATLRPHPAAMEFEVHFYNPKTGAHETIGPHTDFTHYRDRVHELTGRDIFKAPPPADPDTFGTPGGGRTGRRDGGHSPELQRAAAAKMETDLRARMAAEPLDALTSAHATPADREQAVRRLGLTGEPDSLARLTALINDPSLTPDARAMIAQAALEATRADLIRSGGLAPGDDVMLLYRGVTAERRGDYEAGGVDMSKLGPGRDEDAGRGLYGSQDLQSAMRYTGGDPGGMVLPLIVRRSELGNLIDVRSGTPLGDRWLAYVRATAGEGRLMPGYPHLSGVLHPGIDMPIGLGRGGRGARFEDFLRLVAADPSLPEAMRRAAADPHITLMDLGGVASWGNDRGMMTDQFAMHHQRVADLFNDAHGFPIPWQDGDGTFRSLTGDAANDNPVLKSVPGLKEQDLAPASLPIEAAMTAMGDRFGKRVDRWQIVTERLVGLDRVGALDVLLSEPEQRPALLEAFRQRLIDAGVPLNIAERRMRQLDFMTAQGGNAFRRAYDHELGRSTRAQLPKRWSNKLRGWVADSPILLHMAGADTARVAELHSMYIKLPKRAPHDMIGFERYVVSMTKADTVLGGELRAIRSAIASESGAMTRLFLQAMRHGFTYRTETAAAPKLGPQEAKPVGNLAELAGGSRVNHPEHGHGTVTKIADGVAHVIFDNQTAAGEVAITFDGTNLAHANETDPRFGSPPRNRSTPEINKAVDEVLQFRKQCGYADFDQNDAKTGTVAMVKLGDETFFGTNSGLDPPNHSYSIDERKAAFKRLYESHGLSVPDDAFQNAMFLGHAEAEAMLAAYKHYGKLPEVLEIYADRTTCNDCSKNLILLARMLGVKELRVYYRNQTDPPLVRR